MKKVLVFGFAALAGLAVLAGCQKEEFEAPEAVDGRTYSAVMELPEETKSTVTEEGVFSWVDDDPISVIAKKGSAYESVPLILKVAAGATKGTFTLGDTYTDPTYATYPQIVTDGSFSDGKLTKVTLPASYSAYGSTNAAMFAQFGDGSEADTDELVFRHLAGVLKITINNVPAGCDKFVFTATGKKIRGDFSVDVTAANPEIKTSASSSDNDVTFNFTPIATAQNLSFHIPLPAGTYSGFKVQLFKGGSEIFSKTSSREQSIARKQLAILSAVAFSNELQGLSSKGTANCYIVSAAGQYEFTPTKGNTLESVGDIKSAGVLWESFGTSTAPSVGDLVKDVKFENGVISFSATSARGNAVIAAYDGENATGNILWSWHIWLTTKPADVVYNNEAGIMLDRNLGATSANSDDGRFTYGMFYQWGRKDPFQVAASGSTNKESWTVSATSSDVGTVEYAVKNPMTYITSSSSHKDWIYGNTRNNNLWKSEKTVYDPCPPGYRVPTGGEDGIWATAGKIPAGWRTPTISNTSSGAEFAGTDTYKFADVLSCWYPIAGYIKNDTGEHATGTGNYWNCDAFSGNNIKALYFKASAIQIDNARARALGQSVRCQKISDFVETDDSHLSEWKEGYMDIHQISTGRGNAAYLILPDGTTMMVDMGDFGTNYSGEVTPPMPNDSKTPAEWVADYINNFSKGQTFKGKVDYALLTHHHADHIGNFDDESAGTNNGYKRQGITRLAELVDIEKIVDRSWPEYENLTSTGYITAIAEYKKFMDNRNSNSKANEKFIVGSNSQFVLKNNASAYSNFSVRNIVGNCTYWTNPRFEILGNTASLGNATDENFQSCGIRISYGDFDWYTGGDIMTADAETKLAGVIGITDAVVCNHHASGDNSMTPSFVSGLQATAWIIPAWGESHASSTAVGNMLSTSLYTGDRHIFAAGITEASKTNLGTDADKIKVGHIVIRVYEGGSTWQVFVLDQTFTDYHILYRSEVFNSK